MNNTTGFSKSFFLLHMNVVMALAFFGNLFLVFVIWRGSRVTKHKISPVQLLLLHTCVADILFAILALGTEVAVIWSLPYFYGGSYLCKLTRYLQAFPMYCSSFQMVAISFDRYQAICRPLAHYRTDRYRRPNCLALTAWLLALACSLPQIFVWTKSLFLILCMQIYVTVCSFFRRNGQCVTIHSDHINLRQAYVIYFDTVAWLLPSLLAAIFYYFVCKTVWRSQCERVPSYSSSGCTVGGSGGKNEIPQKVSYRTQDYVNRLRKKSLGLRNQTSEFDRKRIQTVRLTLTIVACNFFLWAPYCLMNVFQAFVPSSNENYRYVITYILILGNLNSCVNPWIYILFNGRMTKRALTSIVDSVGVGGYSPSATRMTQKRSSEANNNNANFQRASIISNSLISKNYMPRSSLTVDAKAIAKTKM